MKIGFHEIAPGVKSHGRLVTSLMLAMFALVILVGLVMGILDWAVRGASSLSTWIGLTVVALSMEGLTGAMKVWTKKIEVKSGEGKDNNG